MILSRDFLRVKSHRNSDITTYFVTILGLIAFAATAQSDDSDFLAGVRIGMSHPSGIVVWPVDTSPDDATWFAKDNWSERDQRRRQAMKMTDHAITAWPGFRSLQGLRITMFIGDRAIHTIVRGIARIPAGCGEFEPSWYASTTGYLTETAFLPSDKPFIPHDWKPVLVLTEPNQKIRVHVPEPIMNWPETLIRTLISDDIPVDESEAIRTKDIWTVYSDRVSEPTREGAARTTWLSVDQNFVRLHKDITNGTIESYIERVSSEGSTTKFSFFRKFVGRVHALLESEKETIFLTKYMGWESNRSVLERLQDGQLQTLRVDGFDRGC